jgi:hypothetical protein
LNFALGSGTLNVSAAVAPTGSAALAFELGAFSDQVTLPSGTLNIGSGVLAFDDFTFSDAGGLTTGIYPLFDSSVPIAGTLDAAHVTGTIGTFNAALALADNGNDLVLLVVPEPGSVGLVLAGMGMMGVVRRRRGAVSSKR